MSKNEFEQVSLKAVISYSKQKESPKITVLDSITDDKFREIGELIGRLKLLFLCVPRNMIVFTNNEKRNCYYPRDVTARGIAEYNKLEKLFKKWGFSSSH